MNAHEAFWCDRPKAGVAATVAGRRAGRWRGLLLGLLVFAVGSTAQAQGISKEYQLKAAFLFNFTKFVEWPADRFQTETSPIIIAVLGQNPFDAELHKLVAGRSVHGRFIQLRHITTADEISDVHVVFIPTGEEARLGAGMLREAGVLTVGESALFAERGGIIRFILIDEKVRFEINQASGERAGLKLSGQLLKLATALRRTP